MSFASLNLDERIMRALEELNFSEATPIQSQAIPLVLEGRDLMASAQTGTGKTAAFVLPALHKMLTTEAARGRGPRLLILSPTRELAEQINEAIQSFSKFCRVKTAVIVGGVSYFHQERALKGTLDVIVATPGRLMDHMSKDRIDFSRMEMLVLDEADRMLDMGFIEDIETIAAALPENRQTLLFSATLEGEVLRVARDILNNPERIQIAGVKSEHAQIEQLVYAADDDSHKQALLRHLINRDEVYQAVVFVATKTGADDLADDLKAANIKAMSLHGDMKQQHRRRVIERMHDGRVKVLVATDVAARGLDVRGITHVFNYELPMVPEDYVHRIGRTGRGGASGEAVSLISPMDWRKWFRIEKLLGRKFEEIEVDGLEPKRGRPAREARGGGRGDGRGEFRGGRNSGRSNGGGRRFEGRGRDREDGVFVPDGERGDKRFSRDRTDRFFAPRNRNDAPRGRDESRNDEFRPRRERSRFAGNDAVASNEQPRFRVNRDTPREFNREEGSGRRERSNEERGPRREFNSDRPRREFSNDRSRREFNSERPRREFDSERPKREFGDRPVSRRRPEAEFASDAPRQPNRRERRAAQFGHSFDAHPEANAGHHAPRRPHGERGEPEFRVANAGRRDEF
ncbi:DEAD/DEAH box helicase [Permianibacter aggregans]|uniref:Superfamily II DNA/RNA helicase n=1 Tax=Permianibacter aggregans TaxID=1510150 RepID=A0A4R6UVN6_9GAMM|nr:DEAD/DEAH box helicase [Permianibacter aggregans]QGX41518.1 DEAD/DEAH box helicase [Permianibacter aggregans]TDQ51312.1 superfamily II DNA/RNA helicase [Permianibacter aggregans]